MARFSDTPEGLPDSRMGAAMTSMWVTVQEPAVQHTLGQVLLAAAAALVTVGGAAAVLWWLVWPRIRDGIEKVARQVNETHKSVTVNGGKNSPPTLRDDMSHLKSQVQQLIVVSGATAQRTSDLGDRIDDLRQLAEDTRDDLREHETRGRQYLGQVDVVLRGKGIELPPAD